MFKTKPIYALLLLICLISPALAGSQPVRYNLAEKNWLNQHEILRVGVVELTPPLLFYAGGNNPQGLVADYLRALAPHLGVQLEIRRFADREQLVAALQDGQVDALGAWAVGLDRAGLVTPTRPYLSLPLALYGVTEIPAAGLRGLSGERLAVLKGSLLQQITRLTPGLNVIPYETLEQALRAAANGEVRAYLGDAASTDYQLKRASFGELEKQMTVALTFDLSLASRLGETAVSSLLQKGLDRIGPDELQEIWHRWPGVERPQQYSAGFSPLLLWLPLFVFWSVFLVWAVKRQVVRREQRYHVHLKRTIRRFQRRERALKEKLLALSHNVGASQAEMSPGDRLNLIDQIMPSAAWVWGPSATVCEWDDRMYSLFRQDPKAFKPTPEAILEQVHEEDREQVAALFRLPEGESESRLSYRLVLPDGETRWLLDFSHFSSEQGEAEGQRTGLCWDITDYLISRAGKTTAQPVES